MTAAVQIYSRDFDADFFKLPGDVQTRIAARLIGWAVRCIVFPSYECAGPIVTGSELGLTA